MWDVLSMTLLLLTGLFLIFIVLLQRGRGGGLAGAFGGMGGQSAFGTKAGDVFTKITVIVAVLWVGLAGASGFALRAGAERLGGQLEAPEQPEASAVDTDSEKTGKVKEPPPAPSEKKKSTTADDGEDTGAKKSTSEGGGAKTGSEGPAFPSDSSQPNGGDDTP